MGGATPPARSRRPTTAGVVWHIPDGKLILLADGPDLLQNAEDAEDWVGLVNQGDVFISCVGYAISQQDADELLQMLPREFDLEKLFEVSAPGATFRLQAK